MVKIKIALTALASLSLTAIVTATGGRQEKSEAHNLYSFLFRSANQGDTQLAATNRHSDDVNRYGSHARVREDLLDRDHQHYRTQLTPKGPGKSGYGGVDQQIFYHRLLH
jgi:hypothetical protein